LMRGSQYFAATPQGKMVSTQSFDLWWYKGDFSEDNFVVKAAYVSLSRFGGLTPLLKYRLKGVNACWSTTSETMTLSTAMFSTSNEPTRQEQIEDEIECLPNPTTNQTLLRWDADIDRIEVVSESGQRVRTFNVSGLTQKIVDMSHMQSGIYFVRFLSGSSIVATKKLIKQ
ncbi:MAG: T9SS type A sorting domain-containing protein, partial [Bacteroidales bacterium]|nr:T9SS type A sorting domain-containing protein [Bacteroidales bacterium]